MERGILIHEGQQECPYLPGQVACMPLYRQQRILSLTETDARFAMSERRVGQSLYRTECPACSACKGIRILVNQFVMSKSQRRVWNRWKKLGSRLRITMGPASYSEEKLALYNRHKQKRNLVSSEDGLMDAAGYVGWLIRSCFQTAEMCFYIDGHLVGVGILDLGATAISSVYFYFDPDPEWSALSPGVFSVLQEIGFCRRTGRTHHYLGLYVAECGKLNYKANYLPHQRLVDGEWHTFQ